MTERRETLGPAEYEQALWEETQRQQAAALEEAERATHENGEGPGAERLEGPQPTMDTAQQAAYVQRAQQFPGAQMPQMPPMPQIPVTDFSKGMSYGIAAGVVLGGIVVVYLLNRNREEAGGSSGGGGEGG